MRMFLAELPRRGVIEITGPDRVGFLQGLVSNDVTDAAPDRAVWAAFLTAQGHWLADFFVIGLAERLLLECERAAIPRLLGRLVRYRLRADVALTDTSEQFTVYAAWEGAPAAAPGVVSVSDPRLPEAGSRVLSPAPLVTNASFDMWDRHRLALGLPDGSRDLEVDRTLLLEAGFDELHGVSWTKGCYLGQEVTARTRYRGLVRRRLVPVTIAGPASALGTPILRDDAPVGFMRSSAGDRGLAMLRRDAFAGPLAAGDAALAVVLPAWFALDPRAPEAVLAERR